MKRKFVAFWDMVIASIASLLGLSLALWALDANYQRELLGNNNDLDLALIYALSIAIPATVLLTMQKITIDLSCDKVELFYLVNFSKNDKDLHSNWNIHPSQVEIVEVVELSKEEKRKYTSAKFLFSKYLKITMKYGHTKYVYVSHYSDDQIKNIIKMLTSHKKI